MNDTPKCSEAVARLHLKKAIAGLVKACPMSIDNPSLCPLHPVRKKGRTLRTRWLDALTVEDMAYIADYHKVCLKWQEAGCP